MSTDAMTQFWCDGEGPPTLGLSNMISVCLIGAAIWSSHAWMSILVPLAWMAVALITNDYSKMRKKDYLIQTQCSLGNHELKCSRCGAKDGSNVN